MIDYNTIITGSYNWSYKAENNFENIVINYNDTSLAEQFVTEFIQIKNKYYPDVPKIENDFPLEKIIKRLETLKNFIILEDIEDLKSGTVKLIQYNFNEDIKTIIDAIVQKEYLMAIAKIQIFINSYQQLSIWKDPEIAGLKLEIKTLENQLNAFDNEKIELEKLLSDFQHRHTSELGEIILEILKLRKIKYKDYDKKAQEAEDDFNHYNEQFENEKDKHQFELNEDERKELKNNFRKASTLCHPDKVTEEQKDEEQKVFIELKEAYDQHDLEKVKRILKDLQTVNSFCSQSDTISEKEQLKVIVEKLRQKLQQLEKEIINIKESETFSTINTIEDWDIYFNETKTQLEQELQSLTLQIES
ncbi:MAG: molecular chaperone DnaJ [Burkholderiales bacterium]|nr:molecular chaperone DnaJ [Flavobacterium sp.]